jgi:hypothetical protein
LNWRRRWPLCLGCRITNKTLPQIVPISACTVHAIYCRHTLCRCSSASQDSNASASPGFCLHLEWHRDLHCGLPPSLDIEYQHSNSTPHHTLAAQCQHKLWSVRSNPCLAWDTCRQRHSPGWVRREFSRRAELAGRCCNQGAPPLPSIVHHLPQQQQTWYITVRAAHTRQVQHIVC